MRLAVFFLLSKRILDVTASVPSTRSIWQGALRCPLANAASRS